MHVCIWTYIPKYRAISVNAIGISACALMLHDDAYTNARAHIYPNYSDIPNIKLLFNRI